MNISDRNMDIEPIEQKPSIPYVQDEKQAFFNFIKSIIGIGAISFPFAANKVGWLGSILITIPVLFCTIKYFYLHL
ncbi:unnamed protein product [Paramecium sonneborni]|uniref:Amino acid transporter transmembrane domain-containing protein n=1 Tax=Paramecium sonneborni TaxID=65129 RepID=A0A8S1Q2B4_9CILI|nr:unnamed protein product [Paramecium sonneborni]